MPEAPHVSLLTRYVLENPWPVAIALLAIAGFMAWTGFREGIEKRQKAAGVLALLAIGVLALGFAIVTSGEHARAVTKKLIEASVRKDLVTTDKLLAPNAMITFGRPENPGFDRQFLMARLEAFHQKYTIDSNRVTMLRGYSESSTAATVHLACFTTIQEFASYPSPSQWVLRVEKQPEGTWQISRLACISVNGQVWSGDF